ncbi:MAG: stage II sporulation protein R [Ruminococcaceae bacterium]|nr:stage II sporulation protein R [Oscillospiraceae bacterium]
MDGVFMKKMISFLLFSILFVSIFYVFSCYQDKVQLRREVIRLHVVANSDTEADQAQKLRVRDAVNAYLMDLLENANSADDARKVISSHLTELEATAKDVLKAEGSDFAVHATLTEETFDVREYDTFTLPSGVYSSLRIELGAAEGRNWWCVVFPALCLPAAGENIQDVTTAAGFSEGLSGGITGKYQFRFFVLDLLGQAEKFFFNQ